MPAPYRMEPTEGEPFKSYFGRVVKMVPVEVIGLYLGIAGLIPDKEKGWQLIWAILCLGCVIPSRILGTQDRQGGKGIDWVVVVLSCVAYMIWIYTIGGPFKSYQIYNAVVAGALSALWTFIVPLIYRGGVGNGSQTA